MRLTIFALMISVLQTLALDTFSQQSKVSVNVENVSMSEIFSIIEGQTSLSFMYKDSDVVNFNGLSLKIDEATVKSVLEDLFKDKNLDYVFVDNVVVIKPSNKVIEQKAKTIKGVVKDEKGLPLPGVTVVVKGTSFGVSTDAEGKFKLEVPEKDKVVLVFSFIGMKTQEVEYKGQKSLDIKMLADAQEMDEVVVTGYFERNKNSFTGSAKTIKGEELLEVSQTSVLQAISVLEPSVQILESNEMGSNPNYVPEIIIRGTTSLAAENEVGLNRPLIVLDGVIISLQELYDIDLFDISRIDILKDASATAIYGEKGANGVILVTRKKVTDPKLKLRYNVVPTYQFPDTEVYNLCNPAQKLELEKIAGLYYDEMGTKGLAEVYNEKFKRIRQGVNTDWLAIPLQNSFGLNHSASMSGRSGNLSYNATARYSDSKGVMKDDYRKNYGFGIFFSYYLDEKVVISFRANYSENENSPSKYGSFSKYIKLNPYDLPYDEFGKLNKILSFNTPNPLYEASLSSFAKNNSRTFSAYFDVKWNLTKNFFIKSDLSISKSSSDNERYLSPDSFSFNDKSRTEKGTYSVSNSGITSMISKFSLNYNKILDDRGTVLTMNAGADIEKTTNKNHSFVAKGFLKDHLDALSFATAFKSEKPQGMDNLATKVGGFAALNFTLINKYFLDGSYRVTGSSRFGKHHRFAPFWAVGFGWNVHNEEFLKTEWMDILRIRASYGHTGSVNFPANQAMTTYKYMASNYYLTGIGANPMTMGNPDLKWQTTKAANFGISSTFFNNRLNINFDTYKNKTVDMLIAVNLPYSSGVSTVKDNFGSQENTGYELSISGLIIKNKDWVWRLNANTSKSKTKILGISNALKRLNDIAKIQNTSAPKMQLEEGKSPFAIYAVRSAGIDPASGKEIFITKDNEYTFTYNAQDKVAVGNTTPDFRGSFSSSVVYKNLSLNINCRYSLGGDIYNSTRADKVENIDPEENVDVRALTERWKNPGDISPYLSLVTASKGSKLHTSRFVERNNEFNISNIGIKYQFNSSIAKKLKLKRLVIGFSVGDIARWSTVRRERGTSYPYSRNFNFTLSPTF